jgi:hypothetical protein
MLPKAEPGSEPVPLNIVNGFAFPESLIVCSVSITNPILFISSELMSQRCHDSSGRPVSYDFIFFLTCTVWTLSAVLWSWVLLLCQPVEFPVSCDCCFFFSFLFISLF